eukprot:gb/GFBE01065752.1/.p1 GENE.gb/GFBE01065752.1/~~gb/GFBE01065752.1/.p1  ORF type:complete len:779 (+),score=167.92 gb/GFBE01065752.1/:1-2337(+)
MSSSEDHSPTLPSARSWSKGQRRAKFGFCRAASKDVHPSLDENGPSAEGSMSGASAENLCRLLDTLQDVPKQLASIQDSIAKLHQKLNNDEQMYGSYDNRSHSPGEASGNSLISRLLKRRTSEDLRQASKASSSASARDAVVAAAMMSQTALLPGIVASRRPSTVSNYGRERRDSNASNASSALARAIPDRTPSNASLQRTQLGTMKRPSFNNNTEQLSYVLPHVEEGGRCTDSNASSDTNSSSLSASPEPETAWTLGGPGSYALRKSTQRLRSLTSNESSVVDLAQLDKYQRVVHYASWKCMVQPDSRFVLTWDVVMLLATLLLGIMIPLELAYYEQEDAVPTGCAAACAIMDLLMIGDIIVGFSTSQVDRHTLQQLSRSKIASRYARSWLAIDLVSAWPLSTGIGSSSLWYMLPRLLKMAKVSKLVCWMTHLEEHVQKGVPWLWLKIALLMVLLMHVLACIFKVVRGFDGVVVEDDNYVVDVYWVMMSMSTVGFGDIPHRSTVSRAYATLVMSSSCLFSGTVVAAITRWMNNLSDNAVEKFMKESSSFLRRRQVPYELRKRIENGLRLQLEQERCMSTAPKLLAKLSPSSQRELALELLRSVVMRFPLFVQTPLAFQEQLAQVHSWVQAIPGDLVVEEDRFEEELVFVMQGSLLKLEGSPSEDDEQEELMDSPVDDAESIRQTILGKGAWFGERCLFVDRNIRKFTVIADQDSELAVLAASDYMNILKLYPRFLRHHRLLEKEIAARKMDLSDLAYRPPVDGIPLRASRFVSCCAW